ncbi:MAG: hypothetical protein WA632_09705 [Gallionella sp.]
MKSLLLSLTMLVLLSGCQAYSTGRYEPSADNVGKLHSFTGKTLSVGKFSSTSSVISQVSCNYLFPIKTPDGDHFSDFIRKAIIDELMASNMYSSSSGLSINGNVEDIEFSSSEGFWKLSVRVNFSNGKSVEVAENYTFRGNPNAEGAICSESAQQLIPAVQNLIGKIIRSPEFGNFVQYY